MSNTISLDVYVSYSSDGDVVLDPRKNEAVAIDGDQTEWCEEFAPGKWGIPLIGGDHVWMFCTPTASRYRKIAVTVPMRDGRWSAREALSTALDSQRETLGG